MSNFLDELKRRNVIKAAISYVVISWAVVEAVDILFPLFEVPDVFQKGIFITILVGFPAFIIFAYLFEITPTGFKRTESVAPEKSIHKETSQKLNRYIIGGLAIAILLLVADRQFGLTATILDEDDNLNMKAIAILPFDNLSSEEDAYFTAGVAEDILTQVSKINDLKVLSRFTLKEYDRTGKSIKAIGAELGVGHILTGSVRRAGDALRISCQLVRTNTEEETWAQNFDRQMKDVFAIQKEVAIEVANYLKASLSDEEKERINDRPTDNLLAYNYYLKGREAYNHRNGESLEKAIEYFTQALELDPQFAEALAGLANSYRRAVLLFNRRPANYLDSALALANRAVNINDKSAETWMVLGAVKRSIGQEESGIEDLEYALSINPNHEGALLWLSIIYADRGKLDNAVRTTEKLIELNPINHSYYMDQAHNYSRLDMLGEAKNLLNRAAQLENVNDNLGYWFFVIEQQLYARDSNGTIASLQKFYEIDSGNAYALQIASWLGAIVNDSISRYYLAKAIELPTYDSIIHDLVPISLGYHLKRDGLLDSANAYLDASERHWLEALKNDRDDYVPVRNLVYIEAIRGNNDEAIARLRQLRDMGDVDFMEYELHPWVSTIHDDPRFLEMIEETEQEKRRMRLNLSAIIEKSSVSQ